MSTSGIVIVSMLDGYSRQRRTSGSFSATAGLIVTLSVMIEAERVQYYHRSVSFSKHFTLYPLYCFYNVLFYWLLWRTVRSDLFFCIL